MDGSDPRTSAAFELCGQPAICLYLRLELTPTPSGIAKRKNRLFGAGSVRDVVKDFDRGRQRQLRSHGKRCRFRRVFVGMQDKPAPGIHRSAKVQKGEFHIRSGPDFKPFQKRRHIHVGRDLVDDQAHRAVGRMLAKKDDAALKARVGHARHRDQKFAREVLHP